jgi:23S rRNA (adenine2030-N6)-methyltransferase
MNYRHAFHAGNHGDVLKHVLLTRVLNYMTEKDKPFRLLDAHAGIGRYNLSGPEAFKTGEWREGIGLLWEAQLGAGERALIEPYLSILERMNHGGPFRSYCGSPEIAACLMRPKDKIVLNELHPQDRATLATNYVNDRRVRVTGVDAVQAVKAELPFPERRGVVLLDPAYESPDDMADLVRMIAYIMERMAQTVVIAWYPVKSEEFVANLLDKVKGLNFPRFLHIQLLVKEVNEFGGLAGSGLLVLNPPWLLEEECRTLLPFLARVLGKGKWGRSTVEWLSPPL